MKSLAAIIVALHAVYLLVPPTRGTISEYMQSCPLAALRGGFFQPIAMGDRNGLNPR